MLDASVHRHGVDGVARSVVHVSSERTIAASQMTAFTAALSVRTGQQFENYSALHAFSVDEYREFWRCLLTWLPGLDYVGDSSTVCVGDECETALFFPDIRLNYAQNLLNAVGTDDSALAMIALHADGRRVSLTRGALRSRVTGLAQALQDLGLRQGDRVVAVMRNDEMAVMAALAVAAIGATLATASPDMGVATVLERFSQLAPRLLIAHTATGAPDGFPSTTPPQIAELAAQQPTLLGMVSLDGERPPLRSGLPCYTASALMESADPARFVWQRFAFNHPLFILFSSGTTGKPKCIVHGAGGTLLEHLKEHRLHCDFRPGERLYFHTSCSWMMWNWQLSSLASGVEIITYDGPIAQVDTLWRLVADQRVTAFGTSPAYLKMCESAGLVPGRNFDLGCLRVILSTGAVLHETQFHWARDNVKAIPLWSISGGTDILGCFVLGNPNLPVIAGEAQCKSLAMGVHAWPHTGGAGGVGQLVCVNPFPSRPVGFYADVSGAGFHAAYFAAHPGIWTHGDLVQITPSGGVRMLGRTDGVLNVRGINVGPAEIYRVLNDIPGIRDALAVQFCRPSDEPNERGKAEQQVVLLVVPTEGEELTDELRARIRVDLARRATPAHVPDIILGVEALPTTHNGKLSETAARNAVNGLPTANAAALRNPQCLFMIRKRLLRYLAAQATLAAGDAGDDVETYLQKLWERLFRFSPIRRDDNFFELGGSSLLAAAILAEVEQSTGRRLPLSTLLLTSTIAELAALLRADVDTDPSSVLVPLRAGTGTPIFIVHGASGSAMGCRSLARALRNNRPVFGLQAMGLDGAQLPQQRIEDMADTYIRAMREVQQAGPYALAGYSLGGLIALEIAQQLHAAGQRMEFLCLLDTYVHERCLPWAAWVRFQTGYVRRQLDALVELPMPEKVLYVRRKLGAAADRMRLRLGRPARRTDPAVDGLNVPPVLMRVRESMRVAMTVYRPRRYAGGPIIYVRARKFDDRGDPLPLWQRVAAGGLKIVHVQGHHLEILSAPHVDSVAEALSGSGAAGSSSI
ncbi:acetoacetate--CoA ligase [Paraburkholderia strydomiana]|nr:acetoacetate--CoA ligase [Paraburkholderia strydomiana]